MRLLGGSALIIIGAALALTAEAYNGKWALGLVLCVFGVSLLSLWWTNRERSQMRKQACRISEREMIRLRHYYTDRGEYELAVKLKFITPWPKDTKGEK